MLPSKEKKAVSHLQLGTVFFLEVTEIDDLQYSPILANLFPISLDIPQGIRHI